MPVEPAPGGEDPVVLKPYIVAARRRPLTLAGGPPAAPGERVLVDPEKNRRFITSGELIPAVRDEAPAPEPPAGEAAPAAPAESEAPKKPTARRRRQTTKKED